VIHSYKIKHVNQTLLNNFQEFLNIYYMGASNC